MYSLAARRYIDGDQFRAVLIPLDEESVRAHVVHVAFEDFKFDHGEGEGSRLRAENSGRWKRQLAATARRLGYAGITAATSRKGGRR